MMTFSSTWRPRSTPTLVSCSTSQFRDRAPTFRLRVFGIGENLVDQHPRVGVFFELHHRLAVSECRSGAGDERSTNLIELSLGLLLL
jgi:hypothetical protein